MYTNKGPATQLEVCVQKHLRKMIEPVLNDE